MTYTFNNKSGLYDIWHMNNVFSYNRVVYGTNVYYELVQINGHDLIPHDED